MMTFEEDTGMFGGSLSNAMNSCFVNSVLQVLTNTLPLRNFLLYDRHKEKCAKVAAKQFCVQCLLSGIGNVVGY